MGNSSLLVSSLSSTQSPSLLVTPGSFSHFTSLPQKVSFPTHFPRMTYPIPPPPPSHCASLFPLTHRLPHTGASCLPVRVSLTYSGTTRRCTLDFHFPGVTPPTEPIPIQLDPSDPTQHSLTPQLSPPTQPNPTTSIPFPYSAIPFVLLLVAIPSVASS